eukprot:4789016-Alexandrium_andersonii.AAC.1
MAVRLKSVDVPEGEVYDTHRPIRARFDFSRKTRAVCRFKVPKPIVELHGKCQNEQKGDIARAVSAAMAQIEPEFRGAVQCNQAGRAWGMWNRA